MIVDAETRKAIEELVYQADIFSEYGEHLKRAVQAQGYVINDAQIINLLRQAAERMYLAKYCEPEEDPDSAATKENGSSINEWEKSLF